MLSSSPSDTMLSWIGSPGDAMSTTALLAQEVCRRVGRNFSTNEWDQYIRQYAGTNLEYTCTCTNLCQTESNQAMIPK